MRTVSPVMNGMFPSTSRRPISTAISATEMVAASSKTSAERNETLSTFIVSSVYLSPINRMRSPWDLSRPKILRVRKPCRESSKYFESVPSDFHFLLTASFVYLPIRAPNIGISGKVTMVIIAESESNRNIVKITAKGTKLAPSICGRNLPR